MKQINHWILVTVLCLLGNTSAWAQSGPTFSGAGTEANPYVLSTTEDMQWLMSNYRSSTKYNDLYLYESYFVMNNDIDISGIANWKPLEGPIIGGWVQAFEGTFDGRNHTIEGLTSSGGTCGFFYALGNCLVQNLTFKDVNLQSTSSSVGAVSCLGYQYNQYEIKHFTLRNIRVTGTISCTYSRAGGLVGNEASGYIYNCVNEADILAEEGFVGGIIGQQTRGDIVISGCVNKGSITSNYGYAGGLAGDISKGEVINCLNMGDINSTNYNSAGIVGALGGTNTTSSVTHCLNAGNITAKSYVGYIIGKSKGSTTLSNCLWDNSKTFVRDANNVYSEGCGHKENGKLVYELCQGVSPEQLASGRATFLLQGSQTDTKWSQRIGSDALPQLGSNYRVYLSGGRLLCDGTEQACAYSNTPSTFVIMEHNWKNGFCQNCGQVVTPEVVDGWHEIASVGNLMWLRDEINVRHNSDMKIRQTADLDLSCVCGPAKGSWMPIGNSNSMSDGKYNMYGCEYDGQNHKISNLYIHEEGEDYMKGLFGCANQTSISNLILENAIVEAPNCTNVGALVGLISYSTYVSNIKTTGNGRIVGKSNVGGIVGNLDGRYSSIKKCSNYRPVTGVSEVGGIAGYADQSSLVCDCFNDAMATITASGKYAGGIVGYAFSVTLQRSANQANVSCDEYAGGIVGAVSQSGGSLQDCYSAGTITSKNPGGIASRYYAHDLMRCLFTGNVEHQGTSDYFGLIIGYCEEFHLLSHYGNYFSTSCKLTQKGVEQPLLGSVFTSGRLNRPSGESVSAEDLESGLVAYNLQEAREDLVWGQQLGHDKLPVLGGPRVWRGQYVHADERPKYATPLCSNTERLLEEYEPHHINAGVCTFCGLTNGEKIVYSPTHVYDTEGWTSTMHNHNGKESHSWTITGAKVGDKISFNYDVDSESAYDWLRLYVCKDGWNERVMIMETSGKHTGMHYAYETLEEGNYILEAEYTKDSSSSSGEDNGHVYNVTGPNSSYAGIKGDINHDTVFDKKDVDALRDIIKRYTVPEDIIGDFNGDGRTTISDLNIMLKYLLHP